MECVTWAGSASAAKNTHALVASVPSSYADGSSACHDTKGLLSIERKRVTTLCRTAISHDNLVFAWIEDKTAFATLWELGYAKALNKVVVVAFKTDINLQDLWFVKETADIFIVSPSPAEAWSEMLYNMKYYGDCKHLKHLLEKEPGEETYAILSIFLFLCNAFVSVQLGFAPCFLVSQKFFQALFLILL